MVLLINRVETVIGREIVLCAGLVAAFVLVAGADLQAQETPALTIEQAVQTAVSRNPTVQAAREQVAAASARVRAARADRRPRLDIEAEYLRVSTPAGFTIPSLGPGLPEREVAAAAEENLITTLRGRQAVYTGGRIPAQISRAEALLDVAFGGLGATESQVALQTREAYYNVLLAQSLIETAEKNLDSARRQLEAATARFEAGTAARFDVLRAETVVSEAEQSLVETRNQRELAQVALSRVLGVPLEEVHMLVDPGPAPSAQEDLPTLVNLAKSRRPEILSVQAQLAAAEAGIRLAESERRPNLSLAADYQAVTEETPAQTTGFTFAAIASMAIFDGGRTRASITEAKSLRDEARANLEETSRAMEQDVREAYLNLQTVRQTLSTARTRLAQAEEAHEVARVRYEAGVGTAVEVADALAALTAARTNADKARYNYNVAFARLQRAVGRTIY